MSVRSMSWVLLIVIGGACWPTHAADGPKTPREKILPVFVSEFVEITPGKGKFPASYTMGSGANGPASEKPAVEIKFARPFAIARYEVTQELYQLVTGKDPSKWKGPRNSVEMLTYDEAVTFCVKVTEMLRKEKLIKADEVIRLPSEAEWEYTCRAGTTTAYSFGDKESDLGEYAWYNKNSKGEDPPVGKKKGNAWGLFDMHGYIWEWCADGWSDTHEGAATDGSPRPVGKKGCVVRGGSFADPAERVRSASRESRPVDHKSDRVGFRCVKATVVKETK